MQLNSIRNFAMKEAFCACYVTDKLMSKQPAEQFPFFPFVIHKKPSDIMSPNKL